MRVHVLGSGAGGGLPQWNCGCDNCRAVRGGLDTIVEIRARTQSSLAVSADGQRWVLFNASPDVRMQLCNFDPLAPREGQIRSSGVSAVVLTNADIDHAAGLLILREGGAPPIYGTERVRTSLTQGLSILPVLGAYGPVHFRELPIDGRAIDVCDRDGQPTGISIEPFAVASKPPPYMLQHLKAPRADDLSGDTVGIMIRAADSGTVAYVPGVRDLDEALMRQLARAQLILFDGTCFTDDELPSLGISGKTARAMGHVPLSGPGGSLEKLRTFTGARRVLVHINNTNPVLVEGSDARKQVEAAGVEVGLDGMELVV